MNNSINRMIESVKVEEVLYQVGKKMTSSSLSGETISLIRPYMGGVLIETESGKAKVLRNFTELNYVSPDNQETEKYKKHISMPKELHDFLIENNTFYDFVNENVNADFLIDAPMKEKLVCCFPWAGSKKGSYYWSDLHNKWLDYCESNSLC